MLPTYVSEKPHAPLSQDGGRDGPVPPYVRRQFRTRVFALLATQLACTGGVVAGMHSTQHARDAVLVATPWLLPLSLAGSLACSCAVPYAEGASAGIGLLFVFTLCESALLATLTLGVPAVLLVAAAAASVGLFVALAACTRLSAIDASGWQGWLGAGTAGLLVGGLVNVCFPGVALHGWLVACGVILFGAWVVHDVSSLEHMGPDDAVRATLYLYLDLVGLFVHALQCLQSTDA